MATVIVGAVVLAVVALAVYATFRPKKKGSCCGSCPGCSAGTCPSDTAEQK